MRNKKKYVKLFIYLFFSTLGWLFFAIPVMAQISDEALVADDLTPVLIYNSEFAHRMGLNEKNVMKLDPALYAVALVFKRDFYLASSDDSLLLHHHLKKMTPTNGLFMQMAFFDSKDQLNHYAIYPILFSNPVPLAVEYRCYLNLYLNNKELRSRQINLPAQRTWYQYDENSVSTILNPVVDPFVIDRSKKNCLICDKEINKNVARDLNRDYTHYLGVTQPDWGMNIGLESYPKNQLLSSFQGQFLDFLPGMTFLSFSVYCPNFINYSGKKGLWLWIKNKDYSSFAIFSARDPNISGDSSGFHIPAEITNAPNLQKAIRHNNFNILRPDW